MNKAERNVLRGLAGRVAEIAAHASQAGRRDLWYRHNSLEAGKPIVLAFPEGGWRELLPETALEISDPVGRAWEQELRQTIYGWEHLHDDKVTEARFNIPYVHTNSGWGLEVVHTRVENLGSYHWDPPVKALEDIEKLRFPEIAVDRAETQRRVELAGEIFGDLLEVRIRGMFWWSLGMMWTAILLRGIERLMMDMYDYPEWLHRLMSFLRDGTLHELDDLEKNGYLTLNNEDDYVGSGGFGYTRELPARGFDGKRARAADMWGFAEAQEFVSVSPALFEEFCFRYQLPILSRFGLNCYGCCEPLHTRLHIVKKIPRLRRVSVSPWCDLEIAARELGAKYIFSYKPNPALLAAEELNESEVRAALRHVLEAAKGCRVEMTMKDTHTFRGEPRRIERWTEIAQECAQGF